MLIVGKTCHMILRTVRSLTNLKYSGDGADEEQLKKQEVFGLRADRQSNTLTLSRCFRAGNSSTK